MANRMWLVLVETSANQSFVFDTNKRRENVGASQLIHRVGTTWAEELIARFTAEGVEVVPLVTTSGKALVRVPTEAAAREFITAISARALREAPGLDVAGVAQEFDDDEPGAVAAASVLAHARIPGARAARPGPEERFRRIPVVDDCASSGRPAAALGREVKGGELLAYSAQTAAAIAHSSAALDRLAGAFAGSVTGHDLRRVMEHLEQRADWVAVIHADGNGLGEVFQRFDEYVRQLPDLEKRDGPNRAYEREMRAFSDAVDVCTKFAFRQACRGLPGVEGGPRRGRARAPRAVPLMLPLILGGDDLTVVCAGEHALPFTAAFLRHFEAFTRLANGEPDGDATDEEREAARCIRAVATAVLGAPYLTACAGVAIVKRHYPFAFAYDLAEELLRSAKGVKRRVVRAAADERGRTRVPVSALDFHVLYDSSRASLDEIRSPISRDGEALGLFTRPFVVSEHVPLDELAADVRGWTERRRWERLRERVALVRPRGVENGDRTGGGRVRGGLPSTKLHDLRSALFIGRRVADARFRAVLERYGGHSAVLGGVGDGGASLFERVDAQEPDGPQFETALLDVMDALDLVPPATGASAREVSS